MDWQESQAQSQIQRSPLHQQQQQTQWQQTPQQQNQWNQNWSDEQNWQTDFDISTVDIKAVAMSWHSFANPNIKERDDGLGSGQLHRHGRNYIPVDEETLFEIQNKKNVGKKKKSLPLPPSPPQPRSYRDPIPPSKTKPSYRSSPSTSHRPPPPTSTPTSALNYYQKQSSYHQRNSYQSRYNQQKQSHPQDSANWRSRSRQNTTDQDTKSQPDYNNNVNVKNVNNNVKSSNDVNNNNVKSNSDVNNNNIKSNNDVNNNNVKSNNNENFITNNNNDKNNKENYNDNNNNYNNYNNYNNSATIPSSTLNSQSDKNLSSPNYSTTPKCVDKHDHGQLLLTINAELEDGHTLTICVHVNDDPADLAKNFCDSLKVTNPLLEPALVALIEEEMDVRLGSL
nr:10632_t:CDS:2 [Entrophospora candida]